jgi:asparagine synthase (glutamine-hydrolysing)
VPLQDLDPLEIHSGIVLGRRRSGPVPDPPEVREQPREVLESILVKALSAPPCTVLFSGGRDSSVMLAAAVAAARRHGLPEPIALTMRSEHPSTWETDWQEMTIRHLGVKDWRLIEASTNLDALGDIATETIRRFGVYWPSNAHSLRFFARAADPGTLVTGGGGDELFSPWSLRRLPVKMLARRRPWTHAAKGIAVHQLPPPLRRRLLARREGISAPRWLREGAVRDLKRRYEADWGDEPLTWPAGLRWGLTSRYTELVRTALDAFAREDGMRLVEPFYDARMVTAVASVAPKGGYRNRGDALGRLFPGVLPPEVLARSTKAHFTGLAWGPSAQAFTAAWDGSGLDDRLVDVDELRDEWARERPSALSLGCLHQAWYASQQQPH